VHGSSRPTIRFPLAAPRHQASWPRPLAVGRPKLDYRHARTIKTALRIAIGNQLDPAGLLAFLGLLIFPAQLGRAQQGSVGSSSTLMNDGNTAWFRFLGEGLPRFPLSASAFQGWPPTSWKTPAARPETARAAKGSTWRDFSARRSRRSLRSLVKISLLGRQLVDVEASRSRAAGRHFPSTASAASGASSAKMRMSGLEGHECRALFSLGNDSARRVSTSRYGGAFHARIFAKMAECGESAAPIPSGVIFGR